MNRRVHSLLRRLRRGFTLIELMFAVAVVVIVGLAIILGLIYGIFLQQSVYERDSATRLAAEKIEEVRRRMFVTLEQEIDEVVIVDDRGTAATDDDITGLRDLRFFDLAGNEVGVPGGAPMPDDRQMVEVRVLVTWNTRGRRSAEEKRVEMRSLLAP